MQKCMDISGVHFQPNWDGVMSATESVAEMKRFGVHSLGGQWDQVVVATDGGKWGGRGTEGAVACRVEQSVYAQSGPAVCEWSGITVGKCQEVYFSEGQALERVLHALPPGAKVTAFMDAEARLGSINNFPHKTERAKLKVPGRSSLRRIHNLLSTKDLSLGLHWVKSHQDETNEFGSLEPPAMLNTWADYLTQLARTYPNSVAECSDRPGYDPVAIITPDDGIIDGPVLKLLQLSKMRKLEMSLKKSVGAEGLSSICQYLDPSISKTTQA